MKLPCPLRAAVSTFRERFVKVRQARQAIAQVLGDDSILEIGCGFGANAGYCRGQYLGLDIDEAALRVAKRRYLGRDFQRGSFESLPQGSVPATVLLCAVLHEIGDRERALITLVGRGHRRVVVCDFDPQLGGWLRLWMQVFEPEARRYWGQDPVAALRGRGWAVVESRLTPALKVWDARAPELRNERDR